MILLRVLPTLTLLLSQRTIAQSTEGYGPFTQLIIRGVMLINVDGSPPRGPIDIVVENHIIKSINVVGYPGLEV